MNTVFRIPALRAGAMGVVGLVLMSGLVLAAPAKPLQSESPEAVYRRDRADCLAGRSAQDRNTCLAEAKGALIEARRGGLTSLDASTLAANALRRCQSVRAEDKADCERLARGEGAHDGTVAGGGVLKQITSIVFEAPAAGAPAAASSPASAASSPN